MIKGFILIVLLLVFVRKYAILQKEYLLQRENFIKILSHDLRISTLAQLRGIEFLQKEGLRSTLQPEMLKEINSSCRYTLEMINMLLMAYRFENGEKTLEPSFFQFSKLIQEVLDEQRLAQCDKEITIDIKCKPSEYLYADYNAVSWLIKNLLHVAMTRCIKGGRIEVVTQYEEKAFVFKVSYTGPVLSEDECKNMFLYNQKYSLVGENIKMYLCKKITDCHNGNISVENLGKIGNIYKVIFPVLPQNDRLETPCSELLCQIS